MKKQIILLTVLLIVAFMSGFLIIRFSNKHKLRIVSNEISTQVYVKTDDILKKLSKEEKEKRKQLDMNIAKLLTQIHANMSEEYWLWGTERKTEEKLSLDIYINGTENIEDIVIIPLDKLTFFNEKGDELCFYNVIHYAVVNGNIEGLSMTTGRDLRFKEDVQRVLKDIEKIIDGKLNYAGTIEGYEWPQAKQPEYKVEDLQSTYIYQNFDLCMERQLNFSEDSEVYLGLWNGYSNRVRMMYKVLEQDGENHYYSTEMNLDGQRCNFINEVSEERYKRFQLIAVQMM